MRRLFPRLAEVLFGESPAGQFEFLAFVQLTQPVPRLACVFAK
jgi:hypothetical protein